MRWLISLILTVCAAVYFGYVQIPGLDMANLLPKRSDPKFSFAGGPTGAVSADIRKISEQLFQPLEKDRIVTEQSVQDAIKTLRANLAAHPGDKTLERQQRAIALLEQALAERSDIINQARAAASAHNDNPLDYVPGNWHVVGHPEQHIDPAKEGQKWRASFWVKVYLKRWQDRCQFYKTALDSLVGPLSPAS